MVSVYQPPLVRDLGSLGELTQSLLPSVQGATTPLAALSAPLAPFTADSTGGSQTADLGDPEASGGGGENEVAGETGGGDGGGGTTPTAAGDPGSLGPASEGGLPFTGFAAGAVGSVGALLTGAGVALRRAVRRR